MTIFNVFTLLGGLAMFLFGMNVMGEALEKQAGSKLKGLLEKLTSSPVKGLLLGAGVTAIIQSSSASVGILQALAVTGSITYGGAIPIILGQNIGTCATALLASIGTGKNARRASMVHLYFNIIGTTTFLILFYALNAIIGFSFINDPVNAANIAVVHTLFNVFSTAILFPFRGALEKLACLTIKDDEEDEEFQMLDERLFATPPIAVYRCKTVSMNMARTALDAVNSAVGLIVNGYDEKTAEEITALEDKTDVYEDKLGTYIVRLNERNLSVDDSRETGMLLHCIGDFERIGDHARNIKESAEEMKEKSIAFSEQGKKEIDILSAAVIEILSMAVEAFEKNDVNLARKVEPLEQVVDILKESIRNKHISRLQRGLCSNETGFVLSDIITNYERVADHCSNIALCVIETEKNSFSTHEYVEALKESHDEEFEGLFKMYREKYSV